MFDGKSRHSFFPNARNRKVTFNAIGFGRRKGKRCAMNDVFFQVRSDSETVLEQHGLYSTISSLELELEPGHLASDKINVR